MKDFVACPAQVAESNGVFGELGSEIFLEIWRKPTSRDRIKEQFLNFIEEVSSCFIPQACWRPSLPIWIKDEPSDFANPILKPLK